MICNLVLGILYIQLLNSTEISPAVLEDVYETLNPNIA
ncbi:hypothetical protein D1BOALGB6SA_5446 [Olavius sp. associated proteobacterium Delta 1]|nr:hypothetical protein D1BOALGB6SA_5446 [Olavius sp. associated proteobacterium Delta 1]